MSFVVFFFLSWLFISLFAVIRKTLSIIENTVIFLVILVISINFSWIIIDEYQLITVSQKALPYLAFLLNRSIVIPILMLLLVNLVLRSKDSKQKIIIGILCEFLLLMISFLSTLLGVTEFKRWNFLYEGLYFLFIIFIAFFILKAFQKLTMEVSNPHDTLGKL